MRLLAALTLLFLSLLQLVSAKSAVGDRLLVVLEDESQKGLYSKFWADLECMLVTTYLLADPVADKTFSQRENTN